MNKVDRASLSENKAQEPLNYYTFEIPHHVIRGGEFGFQSLVDYLKKRETPKILRQLLKEAGDYEESKYFLRGLVRNNDEVHSLQEQLNNKGYDKYLQDSNTLNTTRYFNLAVSKAMPGIDQTGFVLVYDDPYKSFKAGYEDGIYFVDLQSDSNLRNQLCSIIVLKPEE